MRAPSLAADSGGREQASDARAAVRDGVDGHPSAERTRPLRDHVEARAPALSGSVVRDLDLDDAATFEDADAQPRRRPAPDRLVQRLADDLEDRDLRVLGQVFGDADVEVDLDL